MGEEENLLEKYLTEKYLLNLNSVADILTKLVSSYRLLIGGAAEFNTIALAHKNDVKDAIKRADALGDIIDDYIKALDKMGIPYINYCGSKAESVKSVLSKGLIATEIQENLVFNNSEINVSKNNEEEK